ncbi:hypothetical protein T10_4235 [Trichinella papuae]|uniref:Uncharacterized protein n=1 Tax=Trichinella papuae TaxID=268474 RepID=A0A0V1MBY2_9BILA|nr:hypothetical protein T10_4235 [Trichinella papuae]
MIATILNRCWTQRRELVACLMNIFFVVWVVMILSVLADIDKPLYEMHVGFYQLHFLSTRPC